MEVLVSVLMLCGLGILLHVVIAIERFESAMDEMYDQEEREAELLRKTRTEIEA